MRPIFHLLFKYHKPTLFYSEDLKADRPCVKKIDMSNGAPQGLVKLD